MELERITMVMEVPVDGGAGAVPTQPKVQKIDKRTALTRRKIVETAEALIAQHGIQAVSSRMISRACGMRNNVVVQYHFGTMEDLYLEITRSRMEYLDQVRLKMMAEEGWPTDGAARVSHAMKLICLPHLELGDDEGGYPYAMFLTYYLPLYQPGGVTKAVQRSGLDLPAMNRILQEIKDVVKLPDELVNRRVTNASLLFFHVLQNLHAHKAGETRDAILDDSLQQVNAVIMTGVAGT